MSLTGPLYSKIYRKIQSARPMGTKTNVTLFQQKLCMASLCPPGIYHVGLLGASLEQERIFEHGPVTLQARPHFVKNDTIFVPLPSVDRSLDDILEFQESLPKKYVVGIRDCRHHVLDLLEYLYPEEAP